MLLEISTNVEAIVSKIERMVLDNTWLSVNKYSKLQYWLNLFKTKSYTVNSSLSCCYSALQILKIRHSS